ncbi:MAG TPA: carboxypeptidase regulatory-like domain-containing protein, partial [Thermoanaerobaculia bacterium]|nr:carboxypeptidase regulatory-like domain-containing protein [Thermoanaerobaculia bacterium]
IAEWPIVFNDIHLNRLRVLNENGAVLAESMAVFEHGRWQPLVGVGCVPGKIIVEVINHCNGLADRREIIPANDPANPLDICPDKGCACPLTGSPAGGAHHAGAPVNVGSGNVSVTIPLFTIAQTPTSLSMSLAYHSSLPGNPRLIPTPMGSGWTHSFNQVLRRIDPAGTYLVRSTADGDEHVYTRVPDTNRWVASGPAEVRGSVTLSGSQLLQKDLDGTVTAFDAASGVWLSTTDRWGNAITGTYGGGQLTAITDSVGRQVQLAYTAGLLTQITLPSGLTAWRFGYAGGELTEIFDPMHTGAVAWRTFTYQADTRGTLRLLTSMRDEAGKILEGHAYDGRERGISSFSEGNRNLVSIQYDAGGIPDRTVVTTAIDGTASQMATFSMARQGGRYVPTQVNGVCASCGGGSDTQSYTYDGSNHVKTQTDGNGHVTTFDYDANGNMTSRVEAFGTPRQRTTAYEYGYAPLPTFLTRMIISSAGKPGAQKVTTAAWTNNETTLTISESGYLRPGDASPTVYTSISTFDARHRLISADGPRTDVADVSARIYYPDNDAVMNRRGRVQQTTDAVGLVRIFDNYDVYGSPLLELDPNGVQRVVQTDARGRLSTDMLKAVAGDARETADYTSSFTFDGRDRMVKQTRPRGNAVVLVYEDGTNRRVDTIVVDDAGRQQERRHITYNLIGDAVSIENQQCASPAAACAAWVTKYSEQTTYDANNRVSRVTRADGSYVEYTYDGEGLTRTVKDENHATSNTTYAYDELDRLRTALQTLGSGTAVTTFGYDVQDNLVSMTDPNGNVTTFAYDDFKRIQSESGGVRGTMTYGYDAGNNQVTATDGNGATTTRTFDAANRPRSAVSTGNGATESLTWTYDSPTAGNYGKGRLAGITDPTGSMTYVYERRGLVRSEGHTIQGNSYTIGFGYDANGNRSAITYPSGRVVNYTFDFADRALSAASGTTTYVGSASYLPFGPETSLSFGNGTQRTMTYDQRYRPVENKLTGAGGMIADYGYTLDPAGNITAIRDLVDPRFDRTFGYDDLYRLTTANSGQALWGTGSFTYDAMGNMLTMSLGTSRVSAFNYAGTLPKLSSATENGTTRAVQYDAAGNEAAVGASTFAYTPRNFLGAADGLSYAYDYRGLRTVTTVTSALGTLTGTVVLAAGGTPVAGATVTIDGTLNSTVTDANGNFSLNQTSGTWSVTAVKSGFTPETSTAFSLGAGATVSVGTLKLSVAPSTISGLVTSSLGFPLGGASVAIGTTNTAAEANGAFSVNIAAGTYSATITAPGHQPQTTASFTTTPGQQLSLGTIVLTANPATISGTVVSSTGGPVAGATVTASGNSLAKLSRANAAVTLSTTTNATGNFTLSLTAGTYTLTIEKAGFATTTSPAVSVGPGATYATGTLTVDPLGTITGAVISDSTGAPVANALVAVVGSLNTTNTDATGHFTIQQPPGSYAIKITATGFAEVTTPFFVLGAGATNDVGTLRLPPVALSVYVGYADDLRPSSNFPTPWFGSPNVVYIGTPSPVDAGAVRLDNNTDAPMNVDGVTVDLGRPGPTFNLWGSFVVPAHGTVILTQTQQFNFDTSDFPITPCGVPPLANDGRVPRVTVTMGGAPTTYFDTGHILDTGGFDLACSGNESLQWRLIGTTGINANGDFLLSPPTGTATLGSAYTVTATATDANGQPLRNATVTFTVVQGPNLGRTGTGVTDVDGKATFSYTGTTAGTDTIQAKITNASGGALTSNPVSVTWPAFSNLEVFVGYADDLRAAPSFPSPWRGSPNTIFIGSGSPYDAGAVRLDNESDLPLLIDKVVVDMNRPGPVFNLWGSFTIPPHNSAILTQRTQYDFDTSEFPIVPCHGTISPTERRIPKVTVTIGGQSASYLDTSHTLDTFGYDLADCPPGTNESLQWRPTGSTTTQISGRLTLLPLTATTIVGGTYTATAVVTDAAGEALPGQPIDFRVVAGPNSGRTARVISNASGMATFSYSSTVIGIDTVRASVTNVTGGVLPSNDVTSSWVATASVALAPASASATTGSVQNLTATVTDGGGAPLRNLTVTFRITAGPNAGKTAQGITNATGNAIFTWSSSVDGTDSIVASVVGAGGNTILSNQSLVTWGSPLAVTLAPLSTTLPVGASYTATATVTRGGAAASAAPVQFTVVSGPNAGRTSSSTTNGAGQASFTYSGTALGTDIVQAVSGSATSNQVLAKWTNIPTTLVYTGPLSAEYNDPFVLTARLTESFSGAAIAGQPVVFTLGSQTATGITNGSGVAAVTITPSGTPGATPLSLVFAASGAYTASSASAFVSVVRDETAIRYLGRPVVANSVTQTVSALLTDPDGGAPLAGKAITFTIGSITATATTGADGIATATITVPASLGTGSIRMNIEFAGDVFYVPASTSAPVILFAPSSFVIWGGNATAPRVGQRVNFWGSQWESQVTGGDYDTNAGFKGFATLAAPPLAQICQPTARSSGTPRLDDRCWTSKPGDSRPPEQLDAYIGIIISNSIARQGSTIYGNIAATVVVRVEPGYGDDPGKAGFGTIVGVYDDGAHLFTAQPPAAADAYFFRHVTHPRQTPVTQLASLVVDHFPIAAWQELAAVTSSVSYVDALRPVPLTVAAGSRRYSFYSPDSQLLAESALATGGGAPAIGYEYIWFNGHPVAQVDVGIATHWTFTDHLGTPLLQTDASGAIWWRAEYEPFGAVFALRSPDQHQPLRFPGQEAEQLNLGANGVTEREYNITRWYRAAWGRYTQADPMGLQETETTL